ncbi:MAG: TVP38/TMEM64 family protein [Gammaproteobacteria bacterium]|tara:strand:- start:37 stop:675 length:639 start_codon:yes stop_codon:yes gene_type:complete
MASFLKWLLFILVFFTTIIIPAIFLETPFSKYGEMALAWAGENTLYTSIVVVTALTADVFLPVPNGLTNTLAGASLGWALASVVVWIGLNLGAVFGYLVGRYAARPLAKKIVGSDDLKKAEDSARDIDVMGLILARPVPAFAELSTLAAGITKMRFSRFIYVMTFSNVGVAVVFSGLGAAALSSGSSTLAFFGAAILPALLYFFYIKFTQKT